jgi:hypothetical protein
LSNESQPSIPNSELLTYSTVRIEAVLKGNNETVSGTGYFYGFNINNLHVPVIITNRHVIKDTLLGFLTFSQADIDKNRLFNKMRCKIDNFEEQWIPHPDPIIDLCMLPIGIYLKQLQEANFFPHYVTLDNSLIPSEEQLKDLTPLEDIIMIGYPNGLWDSQNNLPIIRRGITATSVKIDYNGKKEFLIDAAVFPGSSGSPVFIFNEGSYSVPGGLAMGTRILLLGTLYAVHQHMTTGEIISKEIPTKVEYSSRAFIPNNLGIVLKSNLLLDFQPIIMKMIDQIPKTI